MQKQISLSSVQIQDTSTFKVVGFYTRDTPYEQEIEGLKESCKQFGIPYVVEGYRNRGSWVKNAAIKPEFLLRMLLHSRGEKIVYLDADARIRQYPKLFDSLDADIGVHFRRGTELLSGTIFLQSNKRTLKLVHQWMTCQRKQSTTWDQKVLAKLLKEWQEPLNLIKLPATYCQIFDSMKDAGQPVIEHLQASRRYKQLVSSETMPLQFKGVRIRRSLSDGSYWIARGNKQVEQYMDAHCIRVPGTLRWTPRFISNNCLEDLRTIFQNQTCYIIGKGPSLDYLRSEHFEDGPIIALNEAVFSVEDLDLPNNLFGLQQDQKLQATCLPKRAPIFVAMKAANYYADCERAYIFQNTELGLNRNALSVSAAIAISKRLGVRRYKLLCFDACVNKNLEYADCVGYRSTWGGAPKRFLGHRAKIIKHAQDTPIEWTIPVALAEVDDDKSQQ